MIELPSGLQHFQCAEIQLFVSAESFIGGRFALGEGGRIENDGVELLATIGVVAQKVEGVGFDPLDLALAEGLLVQLPILFADFERGTGNVARL